MTATIKKIKRFLGCASFWGWVAFWVLLLPASYVGYFAVLNALGPSTELHGLVLSGAERMEDGSYEAHLGDGIAAHYTVVRHKINGDCHLRIFRYGENVGGPEPGRRHLLDYADLWFRGADELQTHRWPIHGDLVLGYGKKFAVTNGDHDARKLMVDRDDPLVAPGQHEQKLAIYVVARYFCNPLDRIFPRYLQGGPVPNESERVYLTVKRRDER